MMVVLWLALVTVAGTVLGAFVTVPVLLIVTVIAMSVVLWCYLKNPSAIYGPSAAGLIAGMWFMYFLTTHDAAARTFVDTYILR